MTKLWESRVVIPHQFRRRCGDRCDEGAQDRVVHELIHNRDSLIELRRRGRAGCPRQRQEAVPDAGRKIDFPIAAGQDVGMHELLPEHADVLVGIPIGDGLTRMQEVGVSGPVPISVHGEFEGFEAMVLRQKGHESAQRIGWGGNVEQDVSQ